MSRIAKEDAEFYRVFDAAMAGPRPSLQDIENGPLYREPRVLISTGKLTLVWVVYTYSDLKVTYVGQQDPGPVLNHLAKRQIQVPADPRMHMGDGLLRNHVQSILDGEVP